MTTRRILALLLILLLLPVPRALADGDSFPYWKPSYTAEQPDINAAAYVVYNPADGLLLTARNPHERRAPASTTKIMTLLLCAEYAQENNALGMLVTAQESDFFDMRPDGTNSGIKPGEVLTYEQLMYCAFLQSANEACNILARVTAGSIPAFVAQINARFAALGCESSHYETTHGLPNDNHYTTAYDLALMLAAAMENELFVRVAQTQEYIVPPTNLRETPRTLRSGNRLLTGREDPPMEPYPAVLGGKTGFTNAAGLCLAEAAEQDGLYVISVVLGCVENSAHFWETIKLLDWTFAHFGYVTLGGPESSLVVPSPARSEEALPLRIEDSFTHLLPLDILPQIEQHCRLTPGLQRSLSALAGTVVGSCEFRYDGLVLGTVDLLAAEDIPLVSHYAQAQSTIARLDSLVDDWEQTLTLTDISADYAQAPAPRLPGFLRPWSLYGVVLVGFVLLLRHLRGKRLQRWHIPFLICLVLVTANIVAGHIAAIQAKQVPHTVLRVEMSRDERALLTLPAAPDGMPRLQDASRQAIPLRTGAEEGTVSAVISSGGVYFYWP